MWPEPASTSISIIDLRISLAFSSSSFILLSCNVSILNFATFLIQTYLSQARISSPLLFGLRKAIRKIDFQRKVYAHFSTNFLNSPIVFAISSLLNIAEPTTRLSAPASINFFAFPKLTPPSTSIVTPGYFARKLFILS